MSHMSSDCSRGLAKAPTDASNQPKPKRLSRPDWAEVAIVGLVVMFAALVGGLLFIRQLEFGPVMYGLLLRRWVGGGS